MAIVRIGGGGEIPRRGRPWTSPDTLVVRSFSGTVAVAAEEGARLPFGRSVSADEGVPVGDDDLGVSNTAGVLEYRRQWWWLHNTSRKAIEISGGGRVHPADDPHPLYPGYTTLVITGTRPHTLELRINGNEGPRRPPVPGARTLTSRPWPLTETERLVLVTLGRRYLSSDPDPEPVPRQDVVDRLNELQPGRNWDVKELDRVVLKVRTALRAKGVEGLFEDEVAKPVGNKLSHNLLIALTVTTATLTRADLDLLA